MPTILLVEDDAGVRHVIEEHLVDGGFTVIAAPDTNEAVSVVGAKPVDLLLVDLIMPPDEPDGLAFATTVKAQLPDLPIIFITGYYGFVARSGEMPGTVLYKPIDLDMLTREINAQLGA